MRGMNQYAKNFELLDTDDLSFLTEKEREMLEMAKRGSPYWSIAALQCVAIGTIKSRLSRLRAKIVARRQPVEVDNVENASL